MVQEDLIKQVANALSQRLLAEKAVHSSRPHPLLVFGDETSERLRREARQALPQADLVTAENPGELTQRGKNCSAIVLVAPSLDLASKISLLQTDCPLAQTVISALFANKPVFALAEGALAVDPQLRPGLQRAVTELRDKLSALGVEFVQPGELNRCLTGSAATNAATYNQMAVNQSNPLASPATAPAAASAAHDCQCHSKTSMPAPARQPTVEPVKMASGSLPVLNLPAAHHPSQQRMSAKDTLSEFVEFLQTKQCTMEKGKPCDQCDICNTLGF